MKAFVYGVGVVMLAVLVVCTAPVWIESIRCERCRRDRSDCVCDWT